MTTVDFPLIPNAAPVRFRFTIPSTRQLELAAGSSIEFLRLRGQSVHALVLLVCYGLKWADKRMTEDKAADLIQAFLEDGGKITDLSKAIVQALNESGVYGEVETPETDGDEANPTPEPTPTVM